MKKMILCACAWIAVALLCFGFLWWNSGTITRHIDVGDDVMRIGSTVPGYASPPSSALTLIRFTGVFALAIGLWLMVRMLRAARKTHLIKG